MTSGNLWSLSFGEVSFVVDANQGANVTTFSLGGHNVLADGSHFRASPQKTWSWPPPPEITSLAYSPSRNGNVMVMEGQASQKWGLKARKRYSGQCDPSGGDPRVHPDQYRHRDRQLGSLGGESAPGYWPYLLPRGEYHPGQARELWAGPPAHNNGWDLLARLSTSEAPLRRRRQYQLHCGAGRREGWAAHVESGLLFLKSFEDVPVSQLAPDEGEVQLWTDSTHALMEMENEGAYLPLAPGQSIVWTMRWYLRRLPTEVAATAGNVKLVEFAPWAGAEVRVESERGGVTGTQPPWEQDGAWWHGLCPTTGTEDEAGPPSTVETLRRVEPITGGFSANRGRSAPWAGSRGFPGQQGPMAEPVLPPADMSRRVPHQPHSPPAPPGRPVPSGRPFVWGSGRGAAFGFGSSTMVVAGAPLHGSLVVCGSS